MSIAEWEAQPVEDREVMMAHLWATREPRTKEERQKEAQRAKIRQARERLRAQRHGPRH